MPIKPFKEATPAAWSKASTSNAGWPDDHDLASGCPGVIHDVSGAAEAPCRLAVPYGDENIAEVGNSVAGIEKRLLGRLRVPQCFDPLRPAEELAKPNEVRSAEGLLVPLAREDHVQCASDVENRLGEYLIRTESK